MKKSKAIEARRVVLWAVPSQTLGCQQLSLQCPPYMLQLSDRSLLNSPVYPLMAIGVDSSHQVVLLESLATP
ncbi:hypothetical protein NDI48_31530 [Microcoleus sp. AS-A8]